MSSTGVSLIINCQEESNARFSVTDEQQRDEETLVELFWSDAFARMTREMWQMPPIESAWSMLWALAMFLLWIILMRKNP